MEAYDHVVFQFPLYSYSYPPLLKKWFDEVIAPFKASAKHVGAEALPYHAVFVASFQASDEKINTSAKEYINYIFKHQQQPSSSSSTCI